MEGNSCCCLPCALYILTLLDFSKLSEVTSETPSNRLDSLQSLSTMQVLVALLALACTALAVPELRFKRDMPDIESLKNSCPGKCLNQENYRTTFAALAPKGKEMAQKFKSTGQRPVLPPVQAEQLEKACTEVNKIKECVGKCGDDETKTKAMAILTAASDLACDPEIKANAPCLSTLKDSDPPQACNDQCAQFIQPVIQAYNETVGVQGPARFEKAKVLAVAVCKATNCGLKCSKETITQKCQAAGFNAMKTMLKKTANLAQVTHAQFRPAENFPAECKPDAIVAGA